MSQQQGAFQQLRTVAFHDTDPAGVVHFSRLLCYVEECEHAFWRSLDIPVIQREEAGVLGWPRAAVDVSFRQPLRFGQQVVVQLRLTELGERRLDYAFRLLAVDDHKLVAEGHMRLVHASIDAEQAQSRPIPGELLAKLGIAEEFPEVEELAS